MGAAQKRLDEKFLKTLAPFRHMGVAGFNRLAGNYIIKNYNVGNTLFKQGDHDKQTYFLLSGKLTLRFVNGVERLLDAESNEARDPLVPGEPRQATAIATSSAEVLIIDSELFDELVHYHTGRGYEVTELEVEDTNDWMEKFLQSKVFLKLPAQNIQALMMRLEELPVSVGQIVIRQGDDDGFYYIVKRGRCKVTRRHTPDDREMELAILTAGSGFGEEAIITNNRRGATVTMLTDGCLMRLSRSDFTSLLVEPLLVESEYADVFDKEDHVFLDIRPYDDYIQDGIANSLNISLTAMRSKLHTLDHKKIYVICSNTGSRAAAAAFLLGQQGLSTSVLNHGLAAIPAEVKRGNSITLDADRIPLVDNVVSFVPLGSEDPDQTTPKPRKKTAIADAAQAVTNPQVQALFSRAKQRLQQEAARVLEADDARKRAEHEAGRHKAEAEEARIQAERAKRQMQQSAERARLEATRKAEKLREIELGCKQAEMAEAIRQTEEEASRARDAEHAHQQAEEEIERLKAQAEATRAQISAEKLKEEAKRAEIAKGARKKAELEIQRLKTAAKRQRLQAEQAIKTARQEADRESIRLRASEKARKMMEMERKKSQATKQSQQENTLSEGYVLPEFTERPEDDTPNRAWKEDAAAQSQWVSDQVMWETTLGIREDEAVNEIISAGEPGDNDPELSELEDISEYLEECYLEDEFEEDYEETEAGSQSLQRAVFVAREVVNTHIITQQVKKAAFPSNYGPVRKLLTVLFACGVLFFAAYYWTMNEQQYIAFNNKIIEIFYDETPFRTTTVPTKGIMDGQKSMIGIPAAKQIKKPTTRKQPPLSLEERVNEVKRRAQAQRFGSQVNVLQQNQRIRERALATKITSDTPGDGREHMFSPRDIAGIPVNKPPVEQTKLSPQPPGNAVDNDIDIDQESDIEVDVVAPLGTATNEQAELEPQGDAKIGAVRLDESNLDDPAITTPATPGTMP